MGRKIFAINKLPIGAIQNLFGSSWLASLWIKDGKVTGCVDETTGKLHKENPHTDR